VYERNSRSNLHDLSAYAPTVFIDRRVATLGPVVDLLLEIFNHADSVFHSVVDKYSEIADAFLSESLRYDIYGRLLLANNQDLLPSCHGVDHDVYYCLRLTRARGTVNHQAFALARAKHRFLLCGVSIGDEETIISKLTRPELWSTQSNF
jgi:hypothetical protein